MENRRKVSKEEVRKASKIILSDIGFTLSMTDVLFPGSREMMLEELIGQLQAMLPKEQKEGCTCCSEGPGVQKDTCCEDKTVQYFDFGTAIQAVKQGKSVARKGWNGKHQYVELATCISYKGPAGEIVNAHHNSIGNKALAFIGTSGVQLGWLASQADMLAEDWYIVE